MAQTKSVMLTIQIDLDINASKYFNFNPTFKYWYSYLYRYILLSMWLYKQRFRTVVFSLKLRAIKALYSSMFALHCCDVMVTIDQHYVYIYILQTQSPCETACCVAKNKYETRYKSMASSL